ncbi:glycosyltransferase family 2 protein [Microbacterium sp. NIBRBAC000506063]|uniref:glycosyltransferase family 2 protein n=1 Tax=Microbacterium sp. NIBRBAC000506063 TaxID=2734618 RepID=UPI001BB7A887|nr:glycosyltransferase family 2 protein [Microbacterium sp. NIBRBAC000506063]QTV79711.1 glycosyltransferase family 2 protein [Microbacterium sp. NIBRBAC000506063]
MFFLDGDDTLDPRALREMLEMTQKSDSPEPVDVVIPRLRGTGGRRIVPLFLRHPHGDIELGRAMETLTPQKLIRREMIERHGLRFPEGEVRLEDGIFMTRAYVRARRIAYCGHRTLYFFAAGRGENISSRSFRPAKYVDSCRVIAGTLREGIPDQDRATRLIAEFFGRQGLRFYTPRRWRLTHPLRRREWVSLHRAFLRDLVPPASDAAHVHPTDRRKIALLRDGDLRGMNRLVRAERQLAHLATLTGSAADDGALELIVELAPQTRRPLFGEGSTATLLLAGYRSSAETAITGERVDAEGPHRFRFRLPLADVLRYGGDRVAMWTVAGDGRASSGSRVRIVSASPLDETRAGVRILSAGQAGVSLDLRS